MLSTDGCMSTLNAKSACSGDTMDEPRAAASERESDDLQAICEVPSFFQEICRFTDLLHSFLADEPEAWATSPQSQTLGKLTKILDRYQEQPHLVDPHLESIVTPVVEKLRDEIIRITTIANRAKNFENKYMEASVQIGRLHRFFQFLYHVCKVRGYKTTIRFFTHEAVEIEPVLQFLVLLDNREPATWASRYILLLWLSLLVRVPFDLKKIDTSTEEGSLICRMTSIGKSFLPASGKERDGAAVFLARLLTRKDTVDLHLPEFIAWSVEQIKTQDNIFAIIGVLSTLCWLYKFGDRELLLPSLDAVYSSLCGVEMKCAQSVNSTILRKLMVKLKARMGLCHLSRRVCPWRYQRGNRSLLVNLNMHPGSVLSGPDDRNADRGEDEDFEVPGMIEEVLDRLLNGLRDKDTVTRWSAAKGVGRITSRLPKQLAQEVVRCILDVFAEDTLTNGETAEMDISAVSDHAWHGACLALAEMSRKGLLLPDLLNEAVPWVIRAATFEQKRGIHSVGAHVRDAACYVCWSFARAYGADVLAPHSGTLSATLLVVSLFDREVNVRRASSAAFQENVGRTGIFPHGIDVSTTADYFTVGNRTKTYLEVAPQIARYPEYRYALIDHLTSVSTLHWDKSVRELAAMALGRLTPLGSEYILERVMPTLLKRTASTDIDASHGSLMALGEIVLAWSACADSPVEFRASASRNPVLQRVAHIPSDLPPGNLHTFGSDMIRQGSAHLITCLARARWPLDLTSNPDHVMLLEKWQALLESTVTERKEEWLQDVAVNGIAALATAYGVTEHTLSKYIAAVEPSRPLLGRRGFALALGRLAGCYCRSPNMPQHLFSVLVMALVEASKIQENRQWNIAEAKRNAVLGLNNIIKDLGIEFKKFVDRSLFQTLLRCLLAGLEDYSTDQRGDVGSWVREASVGALESLVPVVCYLDSQSDSGLAYISYDDKVAVVGALLRQSVERIDRIRVCAGRALGHLLDGKDGLLTDGGTTTLPARAVRAIPGRGLLQQAIPADASVSWMSPSDVYQRMVQILHVPEYRLNVLIGMVASAGGLTESLVRHSSSCLVGFIDGLPMGRSPPAATPFPASEGHLPSVSFLDEHLSLPVIARCFLELFARHENNQRIIVPLMEVAGLLLENGVLGKLDPTDQFFRELVICTKKHMFRCRDVRKLTAGLKISCNLATLTNDDLMRKEMLKHCFSYLVHPFPKVRRTVAEMLYFCFSANQQDDDDAPPAYCELEEVLISTNWDLPVHELRPIRDSLYPLVGLNGRAPLPPACVE